MIGNMATSIVISAVNNTQAGIASARQSISQLSDSIGGLPGLAAFGTAAAAGLAVLVTSAVDAQDALNDLSKSTNLSVELLSGLGFAATTSGSDLDSLAKSINRLQVNIGNAPEKYRALGITATDGYEAFKQLADMFVAIEEPELRAAVAAEALGKSWAGAAPALSAGSAGIQEMVDKGTLLSGVTTDSAEAAAELNGKLDELKAATAGVGVQLANAVVPILTEVASSLSGATDNTKQADKSFSALTETLRALVVFGGNVAFVFRGIGTEIGGMAAQAAAFAGGRFSAAEGIHEEMVSDAIKRRQEFDAWEKRMLTAGQTFSDYSNEGRGRGIAAAKPKPPSASAIQGFINPSSKKGGGKGGGKAAKAAKAEGSVNDYDTILTERIARAIEQTDVIKAAELAATLEKLETLAAAGLDPALVKAVRDDLTGATKAAADEMKRLNDLLAATPTEQLEKTRDDMVFLTKALEEGKIKEEQYLEAVIERLTLQDEKIKKTMDDMDQFAIQAAKNIQDAFAEFLFDPFADGTKGMLESFGIAIRKMIANAVAADLGKRLFGDQSKSEGIGGWAGKILGLLKGTSSVDVSVPLAGSLGAAGGLPLPSFAVGTDYVPRDMVAQIHRGERIVPAAQNVGGASGGHTVIVNQYLSGGAGAADVRRSGGELGRSVLTAISGAGRFR